MLRVGLTGDLGSGKSTVAGMLASRGAVVMSSDDMARAMMQPGQAVYAAIVQQFGAGVLHPDRTLNRRALAQLAFQHGRVEELNATIHPPVIAAQAARVEALRATNPHAIAVIESALIFSTRHAGSAPAGRFDVVVIVTAEQQTKIERFVARAAAGRTLSLAERRHLEQDARQRLATQSRGGAQPAETIVLTNDGGVDQLDEAVGRLWQELQRKEAALQ